MNEWQQRLDRCCVAYAGLNKVAVKRTDDGLTKASKHSHRNYMYGSVVHMYCLVHRISHRLKDRGPACAPQPAKPAGGG